jgi:hypothetical protein
MNGETENDRSMKVRIGMLMVMCVISLAAVAQKGTDVYVDKEGIMRWGKTNEEVHAFGVNYTTPFAFAYRTAKQQGVDLKKAIDDDVYHFARLGFDLYRVHVWDCEISDSVGNLLNNEHLELFDYMLKKMKDRGMKFMITPIAYWQNGWPAPDQKTPGFSSKYGKGDCLTNEGAIRAQENYLYQFLNHVNPHTGLAYKNDPDILAFEVSNEPHHGEPASKVTAFIKRMVASMKKTGSKKPVFYNISHSIHLADAYFKAGIQGGTFQWYPTGLGSNHELGGNLLPNVDNYVIPFAANPGFKKIAKLVYEFDAADVGRSYMYPAMARSFRTAGMQIATQFAYDPTYMADVNTEYGTHYMNLVYAPQKALSLKIAGEVFRNVPLYKSYGRYPANATFEDFTVSYEQDLAQMATPKKFFYTNNTRTTPPAAEKLEEIAGWGSSPVVQYNGTGAYFLDRIASGAWRLEVMPDAIWIEDPFSKASPAKKMAVVHVRPRPIDIQLPDLKDGYTVQGTNAGNTFSATADGTSFTVTPGTYILTRKGTQVPDLNTRLHNNIGLREFAAPASNVTRSYVLHTPVSSATAGETTTVEATVVTATVPEGVDLYVYGKHWKPEVIQMSVGNGYTYRATIPASLVQPGTVRYYITVRTAGKAVTYPGAIPSGAADWDFFGTPYTIPVLNSTSPVYLFSASDEAKLSRTWTPGTALTPLPEPGRTELVVPIRKLFEVDPENRQGKEVHDYSMRYFFGRQVASRQLDIANVTRIIFRGRTQDATALPVQLALILRDGSAYGGTVKVDTRTGDYSLSLSDLKPVSLVTLPRPYPSFLPYYFVPSAVSKFAVEQAEVLQISVGPGITGGALEDAHTLVIESVRLE